MKKILMILLILLTLCFSGCTLETSEDKEVVFNYNVSTLELVKKEAPEEVLDILSNHTVSFHKEIDGIFYITCFGRDNVNHLIALNASYDILFKLEDIGRIANITKAYDDHIIIDHYSDSVRVLDVYSNDGAFHLRMSMDVIFKESQFTNEQYYAYLGNEEFVYIKEVLSSNYYEEYNVIVKSPDKEEIIYTFISKNRVDAYLLYDQSIILKYESDVQNAYILEHLSIDGELIKKETITYGFSITPLEDGYLFQKREITLKRDFDSNQVWLYQSEDSLNFLEEVDGGVAFKVYPRYTCQDSCGTEFYSILTVYNDGSSSSIDFETTSNRNTQTKLYDALTQTLIYTEKINTDETDSFYLHKKVNLEIVWSIVYSRPGKVLLIDDFVYYAMPLYEESKRVGTQVDTINQDGEIVRSDNIFGELLHVKENGNYIVRNQESDIYIIGLSNQIIEVDQQGNIVATFEEDVELIEFIKITDDLYFIGSYPHCFYEPWLCNRTYDSYIVNDSLDTLLDLRGQSVFLKFYDEDYLYLQDESNKVLRIYDYDLNVVEEYDIIIDSSFRQMLLKDNELYTIHYPHLVMTKNGLILFNIINE